MKALITGASSGIGKEIAKILSEKGYSIVITARRENLLCELASSIKGECKIVCADLSKEEDIKRLFEENKDIDVLVNNAGFGVFGEFDKTDLSREDEMINVNIKAVHFLTKLYLAEFKKRGGGKILNVASSAAFFPGPKFSSYYASKAYVYRLSVALSEELRREKSGVTVSVFCPGPVKTEFNATAGVKFGIGAISAFDAAESAVRGMLKGKRVITPDFKTACLRFFSSFIPDSLQARIVYKLQEKKEF
ncbi:MAG: SDR family oxidoreductase [Clostridia bacterium]|nr:SDR family oxidoreductase [Clostridia bacterium]